MAKYVRSKITFTGDPETLVKMAEDIKSGTDSSPISLARILPLTAGTTPEEIWGVSEEAEETDLISYRNGTILEYSMDTIKKAPLPVYRRLAQLFPDVSMTIHYAYEDYGNNYGILESPAGTAELTEKEPDDPFVFACEVWDVDPDEEISELSINYYEE